MSKSRTPVIIGASQYKQSGDAEAPLDPVSLIAKSCREAFADAGPQKLYDIVDILFLSNIIGWNYRDAPGRLCGELNINPAEKIYPFVGGNYPQKFVNTAAAMIASGECRAVLIAGGEAEYAAHRAKKGKVTLDWPGEEEPEKFDGGKKLGTSDFENYYNLMLPIGLYVFFETALKEISGRSWDEHNRFIGGILERYSKVASASKYAWTQGYYTAQEIITPSAENRYLCYPYTMRMTANRLVDMSAALIMTDTDTAGRLGIDRDRWVYPMGGADIENIYYTTRRPVLHTSPAAYYGSRLSLEQAGVSLEDIDIFDIYSCFPSMIQILLTEIGLSPDDPRGLTITGGLPFFGAPLSNYSLHAIVTAVERIREKPSTMALIAALGGLNTKPSFGVYGTGLPRYPFGERDDSMIQDRILSRTLPEPVFKAEGELILDAYAIHYSRNGKPELGTVTGRFNNGTRTLAHIKAGSGELEEIINKKITGIPCTVKFDSENKKNFVKIT